MPRSLLVLLLLANYLLVVGAGLVERPARVIDRPFAYVHSSDCQLKHTLRLACFDDCNGVQYTVQKSGQKLPLQQLLSSFKGLDAHCLPAEQMVLARQVFRQPTVRLRTLRAAVLPGHLGRLDLPPRRG